MKNWKTTVGGLLLAAGTGLQAMDEPYKTIGVIMVAVGGALLGFSAKDYNVTGGTTKQ